MWLHGAVLDMQQQTAADADCLRLPQSCEQGVLPCQDNQRHVSMLLIANEHAATHQTTLWALLLLSAVPAGSCIADSPAAATCRQVRVAV